MSIYVGNLSYEVTQDGLSEIFKEYGTVKRVQLPTDRETGKVRGFGFVEMESEAEENKAIEALDGAEWMGRDLKVNKAKPREERSSFGGGNRGGGNFGGGNRNRY
ncbi:RNA recognition motif domain-containing protein [Dolichospermum compactum]|uniref:RNA-binding region RNP-1 n=1 Tax=Dolichospermum compactum NIES-806 TaxID=1973481 RepID=A0A1Z4V354_9CYAN|nr:RNA-binding protein [Dolichospermum compactum]BAZ85951.1 RNA-binding region RNP-1 [Dolichospermum compactum NIES-806]